jgi:rhomboid protease GluP
MYEDDHNASPLNPLPAIVVVFTLAIAGVELAFQAAERGFIGGAGGIAWRLNAVTGYGFYEPAFAWMFEHGVYPFELLQRLLTYAFIHGSFTHAAFAVVMLLAIGKMVAEVFSALAFAVIFVASSVVGALAYGVLLDTQFPLIGAFPAVYGMIGALTFMLWVRAKFEGDNQFRAFSLIAALMGIQLVFKLVFGGSNDWVADIAGFLTGFGLSFVLAPGGAGRISELVNQIRRRR